MIKIVAKNFIKEDKVEEFLNLAKTLEEATNKNDAGCLHYGLYKDMNQKNVYTFIEEWESKEVLKVHMNAKHFTEIVPKLNELTEKAGELSMYEKVFE